MAASGLAEGMVLVNETGALEIGVVTASGETVMRLRVPDLNESIKPLEHIIAGVQEPRVVGNPAHFTR